MNWHGFSFAIPLSAVETLAAGIKQRKLVNRGAVNTPFEFYTV